MQPAVAALLAATTLAADATVPHPDVVTTSAARAENTIGVLILRRSERDDIFQPSQFFLITMIYAPPIVHSCTTFIQRFLLLACIVRHTGPLARPILI